MHAMPCMAVSSRWQWLRATALRRAWHPPASCLGAPGTQPGSAGTGRSYCGAAPVHPLGLQAASLPCVPLPPSTGGLCHVLSPTPKQRWKAPAALVLHLPPHGVTTVCKCGLWGSAGLPLYRRSRTQLPTSLAQHHVPVMPWGPCGGRNRQQAFC